MMCKRSIVRIKIKPIQIIILTAIAQLVEDNKKITAYSISKFTDIKYDSVKNNLKKLKELELC